MPDWCYLILQWRKKHGVFPRIVQPVTFNEKVLHRNLFDRRPVLTQLADKAAVRDYVAERVGAEILPKLYHLTDRPETIPFDALPERFVVKPTHGSGWVRVVTDKAGLDRCELVDTCSEWLQRSYYEETREQVYKHIQRQILVEEFIDDGTGDVPNDYKLFVFGGAVELIQVDTGRFADHRRRLYTPRWQKLDALLEYEDVIGDPPRPPNLAEMIDAAETLGRDLDFVRADFYDTGKRLYFGELTMTPGGGRDIFCPREFDQYLGDRWKITTSS